MAFDEMKNLNPEDVDRDTLVDITDVEVDASLPKEAWFREYLRQIRNPYLFLCNGVVVKIAYADTKDTIEDRLEQYIRQRQKG